MKAASAGTRKQGMFSLCLLYASSVLLVNAELLQYQGNNNGIDGVWEDAANWNKNRLPTANDDIWWNKADAYATLSSAATVKSVVVGRHAMNTHLTIGGADQQEQEPALLNVTDNVFFVGQYSDASGHLELKRGKIVVARSEMAVAVNGPGSMLQTGGVVLVKNNRFKIGRYNGDHVVGVVELKSGTLVAQEFEMNNNMATKLKMEDGLLVVEGRDRTSRIQSYINSGQVTSNKGDAEAPLHVYYDSDHDRTVLYAKTKSLFSTYFGEGPDASWFDPQNWPGGKMVPGPGTEIWMYKSGTSVSVQEGEYAACYKITVGRKNTAELHLREGATFLVGDHDGGDGSVLFVGQYPEAHGTMSMSKDSFLHVGGELAVAVSGPGDMTMVDATVRVKARFVVGRYNNAEAIGRVKMSGSTRVEAQKLEMNNFSTLEMYDDAKIVVEGDKESRIRAYIDANQIVTSSGGSVTVEYNAATGTTIVSTTGISPATDSPTSSPTTSTPTTSPTASPTASPTKAPTAAVFELPIYGEEDSWDIAGILSMISETENPVGPRMPVAAGEAMRDIVGPMRSFTQVPAYGVHPRIFFGPDEVAGMRQKLETSTNVVATDALSFTKQIGTILTQGRAAYEQTPDEEQYFDTGANGPRIRKLSNPGLFDRNAPYQELINGDLTYLSQNIGDGTFTNVFAGEMALEAMLCLLYQDEPEYQTRGQNLAKAMTKWAAYVLTLPGGDFDHSSSNTRDKLGGQHMAFAYDLNHHAMTEEQRNVLRKAIARMIWTPESYTGITTEGYASTTNHIPLNSFVPVMIMAIEGETTAEEHSNWSTEALEDYFRGIMKANYKFLTYGWYPTGEGYEGAGKNYQYAIMFSAYAKRGYNFFKHAHVQAYAKKYMIKSMQPYGHYITTYDTIGGTGSKNQELGDIQFKSVDIIGFKWAYPQDETVDFIWRQFVETPFKDDNGEWQSYLNIGDQKFTPRSTYGNDLLSLLAMPSDYTPGTGAVGEFDATNAAAQNNELSFRGDRGLIIVKSDHTAKALQFQMHIRQDTGGHTYADRNSFVLSALGRNWVRNQVGYVPWAEWQTGMLVDGVGIPVANLDGKKARMPARVAYYKDNGDSATFVGGDATYAYNNDWHWSPRLPGSDFVRSGYTPVTATWNDFLPVDQQLSEAYGDLSFHDYGWWRGAGKLERMVSKPVYDMDKVFRQGGVVRGDHPYVIIVDDLHKASGGSNTEYQWIAQMALDLSLVSTADYSGNLDPATDIVLQEYAATGNRKLLVRLLDTQDALLDMDTAIGATLTNHTDNLWAPDKMAARLALTRQAEYPNFRVMLYPFEDVQDVPQMTAQAATDTVTMTWTAAGVDVVDTIEFAAYAVTGAGGAAVEVTGVKVSRGAALLMDTTDRFDPIKLV